MHFFSRNKHNLDLISIHIPKTAGTSFRHTLKEMFGSGKVVRLDIKNNSSQTYIENEEFTQKILPKNIKVIHGHFFYKELVEKFDIKPDVPVITWLRDPVKRVISNYYYLAKRLKEELDEERKGLDILSKMQKSLIEYAQLELNRNRMAKFLDGITLDKMKFVGIQEYYDEDLAYFGQLFGFNNVTPLEYNVTKGADTVNPEVEQQIAELNSEDVEIYKEGIELRKKRLEINL